jgi:hypothetical protein
MMDIVPSEKCPLKIMKNLLELFGNIDTDRNLIMEWDELLEYILENSQFIGRQLVSNMLENEKLEMFHSNKSNFAIRFRKKRLGISKRLSGKVIGDFFDNGTRTEFIVANLKNCSLEWFSGQLASSSSFK